MYLESLIQDSTHAIAILDLDLKVIGSSKKLRSNYTIPKKEILGEKFSDVLSDIPSQLKQDLLLCIKKQGIDNPGVKYFLKNNQPKWLKWSLAPCRNDDGIIIGVLVHIEDITDQKREQELLLKAEEVSKTGSWELDLLTNEIYWSPMTKKIHGVSMDYSPVLEKAINFYKEGECRDKVTNAINHTMATGNPWDLELIIITNDDQELWVRAMGQAEMIDGSCKRLFGTFQDINSKKKAELKYRETSERLKIATKIAKIGVFQYNILEETLIWDKSMYDLHEMQEGDFEVNYDLWASMVHPEDKGYMDQEVNLALMGQKELDVEFRIICPNGVNKHIKGYALSKKNEKGETVQLVGTNWDITELKTTKINLNQSEVSLKASFDNSITGMAIVGSDLRWKKVNKSLCDLLGYTEKELLQLSIKDITHPDDIDSLELLNKASKSKKASIQTEKKYIHKQGKTIHAILTITIVKDINGLVSHFMAQILDITPRIETEHKLKEASHRLNVATRVANVGVWDLKVPENIVLVNDNMYTMHNIPKESSNLLEDWLLRMHQDDREELAEKLDAIVKNGDSFSTQFRGYKPNGDIIHLLSFAEAQKDQNGRVTNIIGANFDITELRHAKLKLEISKESFSETFENSAIGMALVGLDYRWKKVNKSLCNSLGYTEAELLKIPIKDITHPDDTESLSLLEKARENNQDSYQIEKRYIHKSGKIVYALIAVTMVRDIDGNISHAITQILDLTDRIEASKKLNTLVEVTKKQNDSLLNFAHIVSHNLRSHSTNMAMLTNFLATEKDEEERTNLVKMLSNASNGLTDTIHHLNEVVQVKTGILDEMQSVSIHKTIKNTQKNIKGLIREKEAISIIDVPKSHFVTGIPAYIESIFLNLYTNSLKYSSPERKPIIEISSKIKNDTVTISFKDNGQGIDLERHGDKIFGMYKTFHKHKDAKGIGLFITKNQIETMGGSISIKSKINKGATFFITLKKA
ncbi:PAS domain S-box protein [Maribacter sp. MMG018]|uniref:PAS domain S-box protein n=1 Tax=Maribacter sp. MMG018 TaxID=2822688 RepID=UPI001B359D01|nr:PAS domain S-box protein [Maribacter sp. MMG018]